MFIYDPTQWLLAGLAIILLVLLCLVRARRWHQARITATQYRTANGRLIERQTAKVLTTPMAIHRKRTQPTPLPLGPKPAPSRPAPILHTANSRAFWPNAKAEQIGARAAAAARFDWAQHGRPMPGPYTAGTIEHAQWRAVYDAAYAGASAPASAPVQTTAQHDAIAA